MTVAFPHPRGYSRLGAPHLWLSPPWPNAPARSSCHSAWEDTGGDTGSVAMSKTHACPSKWALFKAQQLPSKSEGP